MSHLGVVSWRWLLRVLAAQMLPVGSVDSTVKDPSGALLAGFKVTLKNVETSVTRDTITNDEGYFFFPVVNPGGYEVSAQKAGFKPGAGIFYVQDTGNPRFDMSRNIQGRITSTANIQTHNLTFEHPFTGGSANVCGVPVPPFVCVTAPQGLANDSHRRTPYSEHYELIIQRQLSANTVVEVGYLGTQGHRLERLISYNLPTPAPTGSVTSRSPAPEFGNIQFLAGVVHSNYHSLSAKVTRRMSRGLTFLTAYTFSKSINDGSGIRVLGTNQLKPQDGTCVSCERGLSIFDTRHRFVTSVLYHLPVGKGRHYLNHGLPGKIIGGWELSSIWTASTGFPLNIAAGPDRSNTGHGYDRPNGVPGAKLNLDSSKRSTAEWFNIQAVALQPLGTYGKLSRNPITGPESLTWTFPH